MDDQDRTERPEYDEDDRSTWPLVVDQYPHYLDIGRL